MTRTSAMFCAAMLSVVGAAAAAPAPGDAAAATTDAATVAFRTTVKLTVDAAGRPLSAEAEPSLPAPVREFAEASVRGLQFSPALVEGQAFGGTTYVVLGVCATQRDGNLVLAADYRSNGPGLAEGGYLEPPRYPREAVLKGQTAKMAVGFMVETDGSVTLDSIEYMQLSRPNAKRIFEPAIRRWVEQARYLPEQVEGRPVRTRLNTVVAFMLGAPAERQLRAEPLVETASSECAAAEGRQPATQMVRSESLFRQGAG